MDQRLDEPGAANLRERFAGFFDAVLIRVELELPQAPAERRADVTVIAADIDGTWKSVRFTVDALREFKLSEGRISNRVLSDGLGIHFISDGVLLDLAPYTTEAVAEDLLRRSHQYVVGRSCGALVADLA